MLEPSYLAALVRAYASGQTSGSYDGQAFTFAGGDDMRSRIREIAAGLGVPDPLGPAMPVPRTSIASYRRD